MEMTMPFSQVLGRRRSSRDFSTQRVDEALLSAVLWAAAGQTLADGHRTAASALDSRETDVYVFDDLGVWKYDAKENALVLCTKGDKRSLTTLGQEFVKTAPVTLMFTVDTARLLQALQGEAGKTCMTVDAALMMQNAQLACTAMGLASVPRASFDRDVVRKAADLPEKFVPVIALTLGFGA